MRDVQSIREEFCELLMAGRVQRIELGEQFPGDTLEILNAQFVADAPTIFGEENPDYVKRELAWYLSQSLNVNDIPPPIPAIWKGIAGTGGGINSNYGWCVYSRDNGQQFLHCLHAIVEDPDTRQAVMIYQRPSMHDDARVGGMRDFICTNGVQCFVRPEPVRDVEDDSIFPQDHDLGRWRPVLHYSVFMRSNDAVFGYKNDLAWHVYVRDHLLEQLRTTLPDTFEHLVPAPIVWHAASLHVYRRHFDLVQW